ncbi:MAG TPA: hypothetical protein VN796_11215 [Acidimicrobiales bacterium]|nr:hypothetical protein [Acidimicrobiales bacterium]
MVRFVRSGRARIGTGAAALLIGVSGTLLALGATGAPAAATGAAPGQHYLCYTATAKTGFKIPAGTRLIPNGTGNGFVPRFGPAQYHCNPTLKVVPTGNFPILQPTWHWLCFKITTKQAATTVTMVNQFGQAQLVTKTPNQLCVPSWKSLTGPPNQTPTTPPGADHYTCYPASYPKGSTSKFTPPASVQVQDEFSPGALVKVKVGAPQELCVPTVKILPTGLTFPINNPSLNYVCFKVSKTPIINPVFDENQFGTGTVTIKKTKWLCVPSTVPPGTT